MRICLTLLAAMAMMGNAASADGPGEGMVTVRPKTH
ncbi:hypothetical protein LCGC14_2045420, partial [marine sediment metagenome]